MLRRLVLVALGVIALSCGGGAGGGVVVTLPAPSAAKTAAEVPMPPLDPSLPASPLVGSFDLDKASRWIGHSTRAPRAELDKLEDRLGVPRGSIADHRLADVLGLDPARPASFGVEDLDPVSRAALGKIRLAAADSSPGPALRAALAATSSTAHVRLLLPVKDAAAALRGARRALDVAGLHELRRLPGFDAVFGDEEVAVGVSSDASWMVVDAIVPARPESGGWPGVAEKALLAVRARQGAPDRARAPALDGAYARAHLEPQRCADLAYVLSMHAAVDGNVGAEGTDEDRALRLGVGEVQESLALAGDARGSFFEPVDVEVRAAPDGTAVVVHGRAPFGPTYATAAGALARGPAVGRAVDVKSPFTLLLESSVGAALALPPPGDEPGHLHAFTRLLEHAGTAWWFAAAPPMSLVLLTMPATEVGRVVGDAWLKRVERAYVVFGSDHRDPLRVAVFRADVREAEAGCAYLRGEACGAKSLKTGGPATNAGQSWLRLVKVGDRLALIQCDDRAAVEALALAPRSRASTAAEITVATGTFTVQSVDVLTLGSRLSGALDVDATGLSVDVTVR